MIKITSDKEEGLKMVISGTNDLVCSEFAAILEQFYFSLKRTSDESAKEFKNFIKFIVVNDIVFSENHAEKESEEKEKDNFELKSTKKFDDEEFKKFF